MSRRQQTSLSVDDVGRALAASEGITRCLLEVLYATGARVSELSKLTWGDVNLVGRYVWLQGKGGDERIVPIGQPCFLALTRLSFACGHAVEGTESVFGLSDQNIRDRLKVVGHRTGLRLTPHLFRHAFASHMLDRGADIRSVQEMMGHKKVTTTIDIYWDHAEVHLHQVNRLIVTCLPRARHYLLSHPQSFVDSYPYRPDP